MGVPVDASIIETHKQLLDAFTDIDSKLHRITGGAEVPYVWRNKLYLPASMYSIKLGAIGSSGERNPQIDGLGGDRVKDVNSDGALLQVTRLPGFVSSRYGPTVGTISVSDSDVVKGNRHPREGFKTMTMVGGVIADQELVPSLAGYYAVIQPYAVQSPSAAIAALTTTFTDEDNAPLGGQNGVIHTSLLRYFMCAFGQSTSTDRVPVEPITMYANVDNKAIHVDLTGGAGGEVVNLWYYWWYET